MPNVSDEFIKKAHNLASAVPALLEKLEQTKQASDEPVVSEELQHQAEMAADTLISQGLVPESEKVAAVSQLLDHSTALSLLNKTAQHTAPAQKLGEAVADTTEKSAGHDDGMRDSDRALLSALGFNV